MASISYGLPRLPRFADTSSTVGSTPVVLAPVQCQPVLGVAVRGSADSDGPHAACAAGRSGHGPAYAPVLLVGVVHLQFERRRTQTVRVNFFGALEVDVRVDRVLVEHAASQQEIAIRLEGIESAFE